MLAHQSFAQAAEPAPGKTLIVYFSRTGNTRAVAEHIHGLVGGDLVEIRTVHPYPAEYRATTEVAKQEQEANARPDLASDVADTAPYNTVFIGTPNWWGTLPMALFTFLDRHDLSGKTIVPFCTHEGSGLGRGPADLRAHVPGATVLTGLALRGGSGGYARGERAGREIEVLDARAADGITDAAGREASPYPAGKSRHDLGTEIQTGLVGAPVRGRLFEFAPVIDTFLKDHLFGDIFGRDGLDYRDREIATVAALASLSGVTAQLRSHCAVALNVGVTEAQLHEIAATLKATVGKDEAERASAALTEAIAQRTH